MSFTTNSLTYGPSSLTLSYTATGPSSGPLLIFMHGWPGIALNWSSQLTHFATLGFRVLAPDMPGYGASSSRHIHSDYSISSIVTAMLALLESTGQPRAVWVAHDWGCGGLWGLAAHHPEVCRAVAALTIPYRTLDLGLEELLRLVNREIYPGERYPYGQWSYMAYYEQSFEAATAWLEQDVAGLLKSTLRRGDPNTFGKPAPTSDTVRDRGRLGGASRPPSVEQVPDEGQILPAASMKRLVEAMQKTGFFAANSYYMNHERNRKYALEESVNGGVLEMPVLFIEAKWDSICNTSVSDLAGPMKEYARDLTFASIESGHWVAEERPEETNSALQKWLAEKVSDWSPKEVGS